jgi:hypothetical protein
VPRSKLGVRLPWWRAEGRRVESDTGRLVSPGVNLVEAQKSSILRAELVAGAVLWSGVTRVVTAARDEDARYIGFDEGPKPGDWIQSLNARGIEVLDHVKRESARSVLQMYKDSNGHIYNPRHR